MSLGGLTTRELAVKTWKAMDDHEIQTRAAAIAFYAMLAMVPFIGLVLTVAIQLLPDLTGSSAKAKGLGNQTVEQFTSTLEKTLPPEAADEIKNQITRIQQDPPVGLISIGLVITIWLASSLFVAVIDAMNRIYGVKERRGFIKLRLIAIFLTVVETVILVGSLLAVVGSNLIFRHLGIGASGSWLASGVLYATVTVIVLLTFALSFFVAPDADQKWEWITPGSIFGSLLFLGSTLLFRIYVHNFANYDKTYGPLGGVMVLLFWFWISSLILLGAAQVNKIIEQASPLGKNYGQRHDIADAPDFAAMKPEPANP
jgi:membrane protein